MVKNQFTCWMDGGAQEQEHWDWLIFAMVDIFAKCVNHTGS